MPREYETTVIVQPEISDEGSQAILEKMDASLERGSATRLMLDDLGKRKLAYEIRKFHKGHYYVLSYLDGGQVVPDLERMLRMEESVLRFMTVRTDEDVTDVEERMARARELEEEQQKRAAEKAAREAEEAKARAEVERMASEEAAKAAAEAAEAAASEEAASQEAGQAPAAEASAEESAPEAGASSSDDASGENNGEKNGEEEGKS